MSVHDTTTSTARLVGTAWVATVLLALLVGCGSTPSPEREVARFFKRFNDNMPAVIAQQRAVLLNERTELSRIERVARQRAVLLNERTELSQNERVALQQEAEEQAREAALELDRLESEIRFLEQLDPKALHLDYRIVEVAEMEWPQGAVRVRARVEGRTLHTRENRLDLREIESEHRDWVFTLTRDEQRDRWIILDQRLSGMRPFEQELRERVREQEWHHADDETRAKLVAQQTDELMQHAVHRVLELFGYRYTSPYAVRGDAVAVPSAD